MPFAILLVDVPPSTNPDDAGDADDVDGNESGTGVQLSEVCLW